MPIKSTPKGENTRQSIIQAAYTLFLQQGYHGTNLRGIARQANLTLGGVYAHFENKESIFIAVLETYHPFQRIIPAILSAQGADFEDLILDAAHRMVDALGNEKEALNLTFIEIVEFQGCHMNNLVPVFFPMLLELLGRIDLPQENLRSFPPEVLMRSFFGLFFSYFMTRLVMPQFTSNNQVLDQFVDIYLHGILKPEAGSASS